MSQLLAPDSDVSGRRARRPENASPPLGPCAASTHAVNVVGGTPRAGAGRAGGRVDSGRLSRSLRRAERVPFRAAHLTLVVRQAPSVTSAGAARIDAPGRAATSPTGHPTHLPSPTISAWASSSR